MMGGNPGLSLGELILKEAAKALLCLGLNLAVIPEQHHLLCKSHLIWLAATLHALSKPCACMHVLF